MLGNEDFDREEIIRARREAAIQRMAGYGGAIPAVQDTTGVDDNTLNESFLIRIVRNRMTMENEHILDEIMEENDHEHDVCGTADTRRAGIPGVPHMILWVKFSACGGFPWERGGSATK